MLEEKELSTKEIWEAALAEIEIQIKPAFEGRVYGAIVYWITIAGSIITIFGSAIAFVTKANFVAPSYWISSVWQGKSTAEIWGEAASSPPVGHWYIHHLATGDGLIAFGISIGIVSVTVAMLGSAIVLFREKKVLFGVLAVMAAAITTLAMLALTPFPS